MAKPAFATLKAELEHAYGALRGFTLGQRGFETQRGGVAAIQQVTDLCDRLVAAFNAGPDAARAATLAANGRTRVLAAQCRLNILRSKRTARPLAPK